MGGLSPPTRTHSLFPPPPLIICVCFFAFGAMGANFSGDTGLSPLSGGNPATTCGAETSCINGCRSDFYRVTAAGLIDAQTCTDAAQTSFIPRMYLWEGSSSVCSTFSCISGTRIATSGACVSDR
jgi:hypothetical protein